MREECLVEDQETDVLTLAVETKVQFKDTFGCGSEAACAMNSDVSAGENNAFKFELQINDTREPTPVLRLESERRA